MLQSDPTPGNRGRTGDFCKPLRNRILYRCFAAWGFFPLIHIGPYRSAAVVTREFLLSATALGGQKMGS